MECNHRWVKIKCSKAGCTYLCPFCNAERIENRVPHPPEQLNDEELSNV